MGYLTATYGGVDLPVKITKLNRNLTPPISNTTKQIEGKNGAELSYSTYGPKTISLEYKIRNGTAEGISEFRRKMGGILNSEEEKRLIFSDEPNLYYDAVPDGGGILNEEHIVSEGTLTFLVPDGLAHSTTEKTFEASANSDGVLEATIVNNGTVSVPVSYEITHNHENGYIGIVSEYGVMQFGHIDELDSETGQKSEVLLKYTDPDDYDAMTTGKGILDGGHTEYGKSGTFAKWESIQGRAWLGLQSPGSGSTWHGAIKQVTIPADSNGASGATNFKASAKIWFETTNAKQTGVLEYVIGDEDGNHLASIHIVKSKANASTCSAVFQVQEKEKGRVSYEPNSRSVTNSKNGKMYIQKSGETFKFYFGEKTYTYRVPEAAEAKATTITIFLGQYGSSTSLVDYMFFGDISFQKDNVDYEYDVPNRYQSGDVISIDGDTTKVYVNGIKSLGDEVKGTKYFHAPPGETKVLFYCSDFCDPAPTITARIREAYL